MRKTTCKKVFSPSSGDMELCPICKGEGTNLTRGYQESLSEARPTKCKTCNGTGERPIGTEAKEKQEKDNKYRQHLLRERKKIQEKLDKLGYYDL
jgi:DnaJ-class molecular chaperone